jgi:hypothetical protein
MFGAVMCMNICLLRAVIALYKLQPAEQFVQFCRNQGGVRVCLLRRLA